MNIDFFIVVFKTILTNNAMKLMESEDVEPFSHFDVVFKTILTDNAEDVVFITILTDNAMKLKFGHFDIVFNKGWKTSFDKSSAAALSGGGGAP